VTFSNEEEFRRWIVAKLPTHLGQEWTVLLGKNLSDIVLCWNRDTMPLILFVEVKYHRANHGRIGIGRDIKPNSCLRNHSIWKEISGGLWPIKNRRNAYSSIMTMSERIPLDKFRTASKTTSPRTYLRRRTVSALAWRKHRDVSLNGRAQE
jgi:hypothetical protein